MELLKLASSKDILYKNLYVFLPLDLHDSCKKWLKRIIETQQISELLEAKMIRGDGETIDVEVKDRTLLFGR